MGLQDELMACTNKMEKDAVLNKYRALAAQEARLKQLENMALQSNATEAPSSAPIPIQSAKTAPKPISPATLTLEELQAELMRRKDDLNRKAADMKLDADSYRINIPSIRLLTEDKSPEERFKYAGNIAVVTGVPIIVVFAYLGELYGFTPEIDKQIESLMKFYTVEQVLNVKRNDKK